MWIMVITKLPTRPSPPKLSIFWAIPWPDKTYAAKQSRYCKTCGGVIGKIKIRGFETFCDCIEPNAIKPTDQYVIRDVWGFEPNWSGAMRILYKGEYIRVFPHEYSILKVENMRMYIFGLNGGSPSHYLQKDEVAGFDFQKFVMDTDTKMIYDAALMDGCNEQQAMLVTMGHDITDEEMEFAPIGWYKCHPAYAEYYCHPWEMTEDGPLEERLEEMEV